MKRSFFLYVLASFCVWGAENLEVTADKFEHLEKEQKAIFDGHAHATQGKSRIDADRFEIFFDKEGEAKEYRALGHVRFEIIKPQRHIKGACDRLTYEVKGDTYLLVGKASVNDLINHRTMNGAKIFLDNKTGRASASSEGKGPVKFVFPMKDATGKKKQGKK